MRLTRAVAGLSLLCAAWIAQAHEVRPAFLKLTEVSPNTFEILWKQPILGDRRLPIDPALPANCTESKTSPAWVSDGALLQRWVAHCDLRSGQLAIAGLQRTLTDAMVQLEYLDGERTTALLRAAAPSLDLANPTPPIWNYLTLGIEHLLLGIDHILFVVGLVLFIERRWNLLKTITAFTVAHSITLALSVLGIVTLPQGPVEAVIALSILFLARELVVPETQRSALTQSKPWLMAFAFGLLHGFGFAGALAEVGLPTDQLAWALLLFNVGIEIGQLTVIAILLATAMLLRAIRLFPDSWMAPSARGFAGVMGIAAAFWTIDRVALAF